jgi:hypothetical protein
MPIAIMSIRAYRDISDAIVPTDIGYDSILTWGSSDVADQIDRL